MLNPSILDGWEDLHWLEDLSSGKGSNQPFCWKPSCQVGLLVTLTLVNCYSYITVGRQLNCD